MTQNQPPGGPRRPCAWCGKPIDNAAGAARPGRPRRFCKHSCRQRDFESRKRARELGLTESDLVVARQEIEHLDDLIYVLACAITDVENDVGRDGTCRQVRASLEWLLEAARPLVGAGERLRRPSASGGHPVGKG